MIFDFYELIIIFITIILGLIAAVMMPSKSAVIKGDVSKYTGARGSAVYAISAAVIAFTFIYLIYTNINFGTIHWLAGINAAFFMIIGFGLIAMNRSLVQAIKEKSMESEQTTEGLSYQDSVPVDVVSPNQSAAQQLAAQPKAPYQADRSAYSTKSGDIQIQVHKPLSQQMPGQAAQSSPPKKEMKVGCPKCNGVIKLDAGQPIKKIQCPFCGFEGNLG